MPSSAVLRTACLLYLLAPVLPLAAQSAATPAPAVEAAPTAPLPLEQCIARALLKNFDIKIQDFSVANAREFLKIADADYVPTLTADTTRSHAQTYGGAPQSDATSTRAGITQKITTGATVSVSTDLSRNSSTISTAGYYNPAYNADLSVAVTQPLLQSAGIAVNKANINRARIGVDRAGMDYKGRVLQVIHDVESAYYNLVYAREQDSVRVNSLKLAQQLLDEAVVRHQTGVATSLDELQAQVGVANARRNLLLAQQQVKDREDGLLELIGQFELGSAVGYVQFPEVNDPIPAFDESYRLARENQPDLLSAQASIKQNELDAMVAKNGRLPSLNVDAAMGYNTRERSWGHASSELIGSDGYNWQLGLSFRMPWGLKAENARYRTALNTLNQNRARTRQRYATPPARRWPPLPNTRGLHTCLFL